MVEEHAAGSGKCACGNQTGELVLSKAEYIRTCFNVGEHLSGCVAFTHCRNGYGPFARKLGACKPGVQFVLSEGGHLIGSPYGDGTAAA